MKKRNLLKTTSTLLLTVFLAIGVFHTTNAQKNPQDFKIGEKFSISELAMGDKSYVLDYKECDVTGDTTKDKIILVGTKEFSPEDIFTDYLTVVVQDGKTQKYSKATYENFSGYIDDNPLFIGDFTGDQVSDVMVSAATGGSGGFVYHMIATFKDNNPKVIFNENDNNGIKVEGKYIDGFKAAFTIKNSY